MERMIRILLGGLMAVAVLFGFIGSTAGGTFTDLEDSYDNLLVVATSWITTLLDDGFEGSPWDANWDDNGTTGWKQATGGAAHSGSHFTQCNKNNNGPLTTDDLDAYWAASISVSFWFKPDDIEAGDILVQIYNGSTYNTCYVV